MKEKHLRDSQMIEEIEIRNMRWGMSVVQSAIPGNRFSADVEVLRKLFKLLSGLKKVRLNFSLALGCQAGDWKELLLYINQIITDKSSIIPQKRPFINPLVT